jgi:hypothetical protein
VLYRYNHRHYLIKYTKKETQMVNKKASTNVEIQLAGIGGGGQGTLI